MERPRRTTWASKWRLAATLACFALLALPPAAQERFKSRNFRVRVAVQHEVAGLALRAAGPYQILDATLKPVGQLRAGQSYTVQITRGRPAGLLWRIVLDEMDPHQANTAIERARRAKDRYNQPVKVIRYPARENQEERILVTMGEFNSAQAARDYARGLKDESVQHIYEERARAEQGEVRVLDAAGDRLARDPRSLRLVPLDLASGALRLAPLAGGAADAALAKGRSYRGDVELDINEEGTLTAVNDLWVEYYLYSVVACEMGEAPLETLKAQAVAARSEAIAKITRGITPSSFFDFYDNALAQVYKGRESETAPARQAVDATRGQLLIYNGEPADAVYSHSCGGVITSAKDMWGGDNDAYEVTMLDRLNNNAAPDLRNFDDALRWTTVAADTLCNPNQPGFPSYLHDAFRWTRTLTADELTRRFNADYNTGRVTDVIVEDRVPSGRVRRIRVVGEKRAVTLTREMEVRNAFGDLYSNFFTLAKTQDAGGRLSRVTIHGAGFGHGVGMCQMGAYMMGVQGFNYRQILAHYYQGVAIRILYR